MKFWVSYLFTVGGMSFGGTEETEATDAEGAVVQVRECHPSVKLRIRSVRDDSGEKYHVAAHDDPDNDG